MSHVAGSTADTAELPLFPLNTVLFPGGPLPLRIFETRYVDMVRRCMRTSSSFGVVLIQAGGEVGDVASTAEIGTSARIVDFYPLPDNLLGISCRGERKFRIVEQWRAPDGLHVARVRWLEPEPSVGLPEEYRPLGDLLRKVLPELGELYESLPKQFGDAAWVGSRLAEILPMSLLDKQSCLEIEDPTVRLERLSPLIRRSAD